MSLFAALILDWAITAAWPLIGAAGMRLYSGIPFVTGGLLIGMLLLAPLLGARRWRMILSRQLGPSLFLMALSAGIASAVFVSALAFTTPANAAITAQIEVLYSALLCAWLLKEPFTLRQSAAAALVVAGTGLIMGRDLSSTRWRGDLMILSTPWLYQLAHIASKRLPPELDALTVSGGRVFYGLLTMLPFAAGSLALGGRWTWSREGLLALGLQGALLSSLNFVLWYRAIRNMDLTKATTIMLSYPALTLLMSWALGHEPIDGLQIAGLVITMAGAFWTSRQLFQTQKHLPARGQLPPKTV